MWKDLVFSARSLWRSPLFTVAAVLSLALGIGPNTAIFSLLNQVVLRSLPVRDPASMVVLHTDYASPGTSSSDNFESVFSYPMYRDMNARNPAFAGVVARMSGSVRVTRAAGVESASAEMVSGNFFPVLGVNAVLGRVIGPDDDSAPGAHPVVVLSHAYWASHFAGNPGILNQTLALNGHPFVVIGVAERGFRGVTPGNMPELYVPVTMQRSILTTMDVLEDRRTRWLNLFARLKPGMTLAQAQAASDVAYRALLEAELASASSSIKDAGEFLNHRAMLRPAAQGISDLRRRWERPLVALMTLVGLVLLIACANVASLLLARATGRRREIAIRLAMGAARRMLVRQLLMEGLLLAGAAAVVGLAVCWWSGTALMRALPKDYQGELSAALDPQMLLFTLGVSIACGLLFGLVPALQATRPDVAGTLKEQSNNVSQRARVRQLLVVAQLALSLLLIVGAGLFAGSLRNLLDVNLGFRSQRLLVFNVNATLSRRQLPEALAFYRNLRERLAAVPGAAGVGAAGSGPFSDSNRGGNLTVEGYAPKGDEYVGASLVAAGPGFFRALGIPLRAGREFGERDERGGPKTVLVNDAFAKRYFGGQNPVGRHLMFGASNRPVLDREIVGLVPDVRSTVRNPARETVYFPYMQWERPERLMFYVRAAGDESRLAADIGRVVREADAALPAPKISPLDVKIRESLYAEQLIAMLAEAFAVLATLLAAIGLYGVVAYSVSARTAEIGIRMALGAVPGRVLRLVLKDAARLAAIGIVLGVAGALTLSRLVESQLFAIRPGDPRVLAGAVAALALVALAAALVPGWRASRIDPVRALKQE